jgi:hypothetical protein
MSYNAKAVQRVLDQHNRGHRAKIGRREAALIHGLLAGWRAPRVMTCDACGEPTVHVDARGECLACQAASTEHA